MPIGWLATLLLFQNNQPMCGPLSPPNALCQPSSLPAPKIDEMARPLPAVKILLEDGGKPASLPDVRYVNCGPATSRRRSGPCHAVVNLKGFREVHMPLNSRTENVIVLPRLGAEGDIFSKNAINVSQLSIPADAHRAYAKGEAAAGLEHGAEAANLFRQAVDLAPSMALAWDELGCALERQNDARGAREAYQKALAAEPGFIRPYIHLAGLSLIDHNWKDAAALTDQALALQPANFPRAHFYSAMAHLNLNHPKEAEAGARETIAADPAHAFPLAEYILGMILLAKNDASGAGEHLRAYVNIEPAGPFVARAREKLAALGQ